MRLPMALCLVLLACISWAEDRTASKAELAATQPTTQPATRPAERSVTVEGITLTVSVPPGMYWDTPIMAYLRNDSKEAASFKIYPGLSNQFTIWVWDHMGREVPRFATPDLARIPPLTQTIRPGEQVTQIIRLDAVCQSRRTGLYSMTVGMELAKGEHRRRDAGLPLLLKDVPVEIGTQNPPVEKSTTVEGVTFTVLVPRRIDWGTPLTTYLRNDGQEPVVFWRMPEVFNQFGVELRDATGKRVVPAFGQPVPSIYTQRRLVLRPGDQITQAIDLGLICQAPPPGAYAMSLGTAVTKGDGDKVSLQLKDVSVEIAKPAAPQAVVRSTTVEGITFSVVVPPTVSLHTPITTYLRNEGKEPISFQTHSEVPNLFLIRVWDAMGRHVGGPGRLRMGLHTWPRSMSLRPGEQATQIMRLDQECLSLQPGHHSMSVGTYIDKGKPGEGRVLLEVKDVPLEIVEK
jgi:hypothetical protein